VPDVLNATLPFKVSVPEPAVKNARGEGAELFHVMLGPDVPDQLALLNQLPLPPFHVYSVCACAAAGSSAPRITAATTRAIAQPIVNRREAFMANLPKPDRQIEGTSG